MIRNIVILLAHDLAVAFKNKTLCLIVCIPLFVYAALTLIDPAKAHDARIRIAWIETAAYAPGLLKHLEQAPDLFVVRRVANEAEAVRRLGKREVDGVLLPTGGDGARLRLTVLRQSSVETLSILHRLAALQIVVEGKAPGWIADVQSFQSDSVKRQTLPTWILMMVLLVSFIVLPVQVAEEKEKQLLLGWLQTPVREGEWLAAKLGYGIFLMLAAVLLLQWLAGEFPSVRVAGYLAMLCLGGFSFGALGISLGLLCRNPASARALGVLCYLPLLMPAALSEMSPELRRIAPLIPSYYFYEPVRAILMESGAAVIFLQAWISLAVMGLLACRVSRCLIRKRWLM